MTLTGIIPALTTPFERDAVAPRRLAENIAAYERHGTGGYLVLGSTGEAALLDETEKIALLRAAREVVPPSKTLIAGVGLESTAATARLARLAADQGADVALVLTPHYFRDAMSAVALERHYRAVADASPIPVLLYSVPKFTGLAIEPGTAIALSDHGNVAGIKESSGDVASIAEIARGARRGFHVLCGHAGSCRTALAAGASGAILAAAAAIPEPFVTIARLAAEGRHGDAETLQRRVAGAARLLASTHGIAGLKTAMDARGLYGGAPRAPLPPTDDGARATISRCLAKLVDDELIARTAL